MNDTNLHNSHAAQNATHIACDSDCLIAPHKQYLIDLNHNIDELHRKFESIEANDAAQQHMQELLEAHHENEVLRPVFLMLISLCDRGTESIRNNRQHLEQATRLNNRKVMAAYTQIIEARRMDLDENEEALARLGVSPFENPGSTFNATCQHAVRTVPCSNENLTAQIHKRVRPGYRRDDKVIRREYVEIYTHHPQGVSSC